MTDAPAPPRERPISPHLQVWRWHITMLTSILHRASGVALYVGALILAGWAVALASGPDAYNFYQGLLGSIFGKLVLFGLTLAVAYHLANGIRHLVWDTGRGLDIKSADASGIAVIVFTVVASVALWLFAWIAGVFY
ncbi:succinate dehydrogenase, cytochrome b556 subunit [Phenylobacterium sp.]|uniref:succinate dehydrogenase, cytochrome b556 subunit n=1 Tax=Phenylobacterium sp. TaxID=1871053 RepID=UPI002733F6D4|nr:succinate dehydrogenase, cytochrome b556 subunit [Phenylobacterium sp.]MDP3660234.1 succinate dehydrogenase, cytochrome b556 subunit [Phenylobacterium sp.]